MQFYTTINIKSLEPFISYRDKILLTGSCFTEHIGNFLIETKFNILQNPNGILFDPVSVSSSLLSYIQNKKYAEEDLFYLNEAWNSWHHHSRFSNPDKVECLKNINESQQQAHQFLKTAKWIIITLGSSFSYRLTEQAPNSKEFSPNAPLAGLRAVANCHRAPAQWFNKHLMTIEEIISNLDDSVQQLFQFNPGLNIIFTVSPVRHIRDGVVDNNRSKARLIEAVHSLINKYDKLNYFPAYELVIDVLRDYRFYDTDLVHPNYMATEFVLEKFAEVFIDEPSQRLMREIKSVMIARKHKAFQPDTAAHKQFLKTYFEKTKALKEKYSFLDLNEEIKYFNS